MQQGQQEEEEPDDGPAVDVQYRGGLRLEAKNVACSRRGFAGVPRCEPRVLTSENLAGEDDGIEA